MVSLFEETEINGMTLSNRFVRSATWDGLAADDGACTDRMVDLLAELAKGGVGLIITGHAYVHQNGKHQDWQLGIHRDNLIPGLKTLTDRVHEQGGRIVLQLGYGGSYLSKSRLRNLTLSDIQDMARDYGQAALKAKKAGFDGVQIFAAHGFLLSQFLCPRYNDRTDEYGGSIENRARALLETTRAVRDTVGARYPVLAKINCRDFVENGLTLEDSLEVSVMLEKAGIDAIELSGGLLNLPNLMKEGIDSEEGEAGFKNEAKAFKERISVPFLLVGGIRSLSVAEKLIEEGYADYISMCRPFIREPNLINRWKSGDHRKATCISCNNCIMEARSGEGVRCVPKKEEPSESFFPEISETVPASPPLPPGTAYRISIGLEDWNSSFLPVVKIETVIDGEVTNRSTSFPLGSNDHETVAKTIAELLKKHNAIHSKD